MREYSLFSIVFYVVRALHKFTFGLSQTNPTTNSDQCEKDHVVTKTNVFDKIYMFSVAVFASVKGIYSHCAGQLHLLIKGQ
jgi:hypothetical protein